MSTLKSFLKNTIVYGVAAVLPKAINVFLVGLHTQALPNTAQFNVNTEFYVWAAYFNVLLTFGMETSFFRFFNTEKDTTKVVNTSFTIVALVTLLLLPLFFMANSIAPYLGFSEVIHFKVLLSILFFDNLCVIPFAFLRITNKAWKYAGFKILNILIFAILNVLFLLILKEPQSISLLNLYQTQSKVGYIFLANFAASFATFLLLLQTLKNFKISIDRVLLKKMLSYGWPILVAGLAYITNESLDKLIIPKYLNKSIAGAYAGTYKLGVFMALFITAFKLGAEPFFFNISKQKNAKQTYALVLEWFTILGALICLTIVAYIDVFAGILLKKEAYFATLDIVPVILLANLLLGIYNNLSVWYKNTGQTKFAMYFSVMGASLTVVGLLMFVPKYGYIAAAWVTFTVYAIMMLTSYFYGQKHYKTPYNILKTGGLFIFISILCFCSFYLFRRNYLINSIFILMTLTVIYFSQQKFIRKQFLKQL